MGFLLSIIAIILFCLVFVIGILSTIFSVLYKRKWSGALKKLDAQFMSIATSIDASGNVIGEDFFNLIFITDLGYKFGNRKETISSVLGKNERDKTLTKTGKLMCKLLHYFEKEHSLKSIDDLV
jgi:hypothetical protein